MISYGIVALNHDAALAILENKKLLFFKKASEYSNINNNFLLNEEIISEALQIAKPNKVGFFENPFLKKYRQLISGQFKLAFDVELFPKVYLNRVGFKGIPIEYHGHHKSHVAYAKHSLNFYQAIYIVADAIGEMDTVSIWYVKDDCFKKIESTKYPISLGLFYSAFTKFVGLEPLKDENKFMLLSTTGNPKPHKDLALSYLNKNLHLGIKNLNLLDFNKENLAASVQEVFQEEIFKLVSKYQALYPNIPIVFTGGCAYNKLAVNYIKNQVSNFFVAPNPGDATSSIGAAYLTYINSKHV